MIEVPETTVYRGPNIWTQTAVILLRVDIGELEDRPTNEIQGFADRLLAILPTLADHPCSLGYAGGLIERMREGTGLGHVLEHVALEVQTLAGNRVMRGKTRGAGEPGLYNIVFEYRQEDVGLAAGRLGVSLLNHMLYEPSPSSTSTASWRSRSSSSPSGSAMAPRRLRSSRRRSAGGSPSSVCTRPNPTGRPL